MKKNKKILIIGNGFRAMMTAYLCSKISNEISIISNTDNIHGIMSPLEWEGGNFDKGYQFFDGLNTNDKKILEEFVGKDVLFNFGYGASTFTNNKIYENHAIPYWPHKGMFFILKSFFEMICLGIKRNYNNKIVTFDDLIKTLPNSIRKILDEACLRNTGILPIEASHLVSNFSPLLHYRQTILPEKISYFLKKIKFFDKRIACRRKILKLDEVSLYPKGKYIGYVSKIMEQKLTKLGVNFLLSKNTKVSVENKKLKLKTQEKIMHPDIIIMVAELDDILSFFDEKIAEEKNNHYVSQIFIFFSVNNIISKYQYVHGNDVNFFINRINNLSLYGEKTLKGEKVISVEIPASMSSDIWSNTEKYLEKIWLEVQSMKIVDKNEKFINHKIFKIPRTVCIPLKNFENSKKKLEELIKSKYANKIFFPGLGEITRKKFINSVECCIKNI